MSTILSLFFVFLLNSAGFCAKSPRLHHSSFDKRRFFGIIPISMEHTIELDAPCKINLHLRVLDRRDDGFHSIESIFQMISLCDRIVLHRMDSPGECEIDCPRFDLPPVNTVSRAVDLFRDTTGIRDGIHVVLDKQIPAGAGLGGGSTDAAAVLAGLNRLFSAGLGADDLHALACGIGSDVPFFLGSPAALVTGRGEALQALVPRTDVYGILIWPGVHSGTADAYAAVDAWKTGHPDAGHGMPDPDELAGIYAGPLDGWTRFGNSFSAPIMERYPAIRSVQRELYDAGALYAEMSGSGSSVFGLFGDKKESERVFSRFSMRRDLCREFLLLAHSPMR